jgi:tellurite resistance protein
MEALSRPDFFTQQEIDSLPSIGLQVPKNDSDRRAVLAALVLASVLEVSMTDGATTTGEFEVVEELIEHLEDEFELASREKLQDIGTEMGMVPFIEGQWSREQFRKARMILADALERLDDEEAHKLRGVIAKYCYEVAKASGGLLKITNISDEEEHLLQEIARTLKLETTAEGLHLISRTKS